MKGNHVHSHTEFNGLTNSWICWCGQSFVDDRKDLRNKKGRQSMLSQLKNFVVDRLDLEEMFALSAYGKLVRSEYQNRNMVPPEWLNDSLATLEREILARRRDELEKRLKEVKSLQTGLESAEDKRTRLKKEQEELEKQLGIATPPEVVKA